MTKDEAIEKIKNSSCDNFKVRELKTARSCCDLCHNETDREFVISAKHICTKIGKKDYKFKPVGLKRLTRHICVDCFVLLFPDVIEVPNENNT